jgi:hypothetical protein
MTTTTNAGRHGNFKGRLGNVPAPRTSSNAHDDWNTPEYAFEMLRPYVPRGWTVYDPFYNDGAAKGRMERALGVTCIHESGDAYTKPVPQCDAIITNPPFHGKQRAIEWLLSLGKPLFVLLPVETFLRCYLARYHVPSIVGCRHYITFDNPEAERPFRTSFYSAWFVWNHAMPQQICVAPDLRISTASGSNNVGVDV